ncbi:MAG TPA: biotin--[acetyl-CoA-carboxylase] ligase [Syntrophales bacterium]|nr:biotin--[acetyl-CoA-carboxylase] ligase [Syntrophales bacterium]
MDLNIDELRSFFFQRTIGRRIEYREEVESTNTEALQLAQQDAPEGTVVIAEAQSAGRGRLTRSWESPPSMNLYLSVILRPDVPAQSASLIPLAVGVAVADVISQYCPGQVRLKWPNDVLVGGKKICGILAEMRTKADRVAFVIAGIGVNINMKKLHFPRELRETATSLQIETALEIDRLDFAVRLLEALERWYRIYLNGGQDYVRQSWLKYADIIGKRIEVVYQSDTQRGTVVGLDENGALLLEGETGLQQVLAGDVYIERL